MKYNDILTNTYFQYIMQLILKKSGFYNKITIERIFKNE